MKDSDKVDTQDNFYTELINRFFHPESYFFICIKNLLENSSLISIDANSTTLPVLNQLIDHLMQAKSPSAELNEIARISGFKNFYQDLRNHLIQSNLKALDQRQLKRTIQRIAVYFLTNVYQILVNDAKSCDILIQYLDIKMKLHNLLDGSNGKHLVKDLNTPCQSTTNAPVENVDGHDPEPITSAAGELITTDRQKFDIKPSIKRLPGDRPTELTDFSTINHESDPDQLASMPIIAGTRFHEEAALYYKILSSAVSQLKKDADLQSAMEDIELASSSLKHLTLKFGLEKIALLPELIESISIQANKYGMKLPLSVIGHIEDGLLLFKEFDPSKTDHKTRFMSLLSHLKEYYSKTLNKTKLISLML